MTGLRIAILVVGLVFLTIYTYPALAGRSFLPRRSWPALFNRADVRAWSRSQVLLGLGICTEALTSLHTPVTALNVWLDGVGLALIAGGALLALRLRRHAR